MAIPGREMSGRPLHFIWIADCSGSMAGDKIWSLNTAIREAIPEMRRVAQSNPHANVLIRAIKFSTGATWHVVQPTPIEKFIWTDLTPGGVTDMGKALLMVAEELKMPPMDPRGLPPVLVLITDGYPTDDVGQGIKAVMDQPWGKKAVRIAIGIGTDVDYNMLQRFIGNAEISALQASNAEQLVKYIHWASTAVLQSASAPNVLRNIGNPSNSGGLNVPTLPPGDSQSTDVW